MSTMPRNAIERACLLSEDVRIDASLWLADAAEPEGGPGARSMAAAVAAPCMPMPQPEEFLGLREGDDIRQALQRHGFQIGITADALGISRKSLWERMKRLAIV